MASTSRRRPLSISETIYELKEIRANVVKMMGHGCEIVPVYDNAIEHLERAYDLVGRLNELAREGFAIATAKRK